MSEPTDAAEVMIEVSNLTKSFGTHCVLNGIDVRVRRGEIFALLGPNGAGKTTTIHVLTTLLPYDQGDVTIAGHEVRTRPDAVRKHIGLTGQYAAVDDFQTAEENLGMMARLAHLPRHDARNRVQELLSEFDLADSAKRPVSSFSGGMRRRLDLAMSLVTRPDLLFLDEPTTGLDPRSRLGLWDVVRRLADSGVTIFLTTQYLEEADRLADTIAVIDGGKIIVQGTPSRLKRGVGGQRIELTFDSAIDLGRAMDAIDCGVATISAPTLALSIATEHPARTIRQALSQLEDAGIPVANINIIRPTLDDVFLSLTGQPNPTTQTDSKGEAA